ncbi:MAG TPA: hypothetical protein VJG32_07415 [Anaerolineae bacterium]|nr:hypothetical protein [Anaerolineae bacterium]
MELEQRIEALEHEMRILKNDIQRTLLDIQRSLPEKPAAPNRWQKKAWVLALLNILIAVSLFTNIYLYIPGNLAVPIDAALAPWLRGFWIAVALIWLLLQMYPLALLLEEEDKQWQGVIQRNAAKFFRARPSFVVALTAAVLIISIVNLVIPLAWLILALALLVLVGIMGIRYLMETRREQARAHSRS